FHGPIADLQAKTSSRGLLLGGEFTRAPEVRRAPRPQGAFDGAEPEAVRIEPLLGRAGIRREPVNRSIGNAGQPLVRGARVVKPQLPDGARRMAGEDVIHSRVQTRFVFLWHIAGADKKEIGAAPVRSIATRVDMELPELARGMAPRDPAAVRRPIGIGRAAI